MKPRIPPPIVMLLAGAAMWGLARATPALTVELPGRAGLAFVFGLLGIAAAAAGVIQFHRARTTVNPLKPEEATSLVITGIYAYTRNPMYLGLALILVGWAVYLANPVALLGLIAFVLFIDRFQIMPEEQALHALFGSAFEAYRRRVHRWI